MILANKLKSKPAAEKIPTGTNLNVISTLTDALLDGGVNMAISGDVAYITCSSTDSIVSVDISDPYNMFVLDSIVDPTFSSVKILNGIRGIDVSGTVAYVCGYAADALVSIDIMDPGDMKMLGSYIDHTRLDAPRNVRIYDNVAFVCAYEADYYVSIDVSDPINMTKKDQITDSYVFNGINDSVIAPDGNTAYATVSIDECLTAINISNPDNLKLKSDAKSPASLTGASDVKLAGNYAFIVAYVENKITSVDISNSNDIKIVSYFNTGSLDGSAYLDIVGDVAFVSASVSKKLTSIDISDPANMTKIDSVGIGTSPGAIVISGNIAFIVRSGGLLAIDIS